MNDLIASVRIDGEVLFQGQNIYDSDVDPVEVRRRIGMVFQKPNPFPKTIYENVAWGTRINTASAGTMDEMVEKALRSAALWDEVKGQTAAECTRSLRWTATAVVYRQSDCG